ncbi:MULTISPECIES: PAS domain-containing protein [unclassified Pantoea]|uniref:PAS domain-containing protein n=1 Tax=unclassified Pantoea TaxID=2630326 RepID=UPI0024779D50|nr:hypothetical protein ACJ1_34960 [Pantoea sp. QMID1]GME44311.1 hypothetical protein ACJ3_35170 [Pantoea sp. QMID3]GME58909.1 hypothetical protein ACJ4_31480 [Pantoea sp. QMID4]GME60335.1 hypothetical protein ACJ2_31560 [Pantoea sp. QMID2]
MVMFPAGRSAALFLKVTESDMGFTGLLAQETYPEKTGPVIFTHYLTDGSRGKPLHSSTVLFRDESGKATPSLCFNADYSEVAQPVKRCHA